MEVPGHNAAASVFQGESFQRPHQSFYRYEIKAGAPAGEAHAAEEGGVGVHGGSEKGRGGEVVVTDPDFIASRPFRIRFPVHRRCHIARFRFAEMVLFMIAVGEDVVHTEGPVLIGRVGTLYYAYLLAVKALSRFPGGHMEIGKDRYGFLMAVDGSEIGIGAVNKSFAQGSLIFQHQHLPRFGTVLRGTAVEEDRPPRSLIIMAIADAETVHFLV